MIPIKKYFDADQRAEIYRQLKEKNTYKTNDPKIKVKTPLFKSLVVDKEKHGFRGDLYGMPKIEKALLSFFNGKCAFCEKFQEDETSKRSGKRVWQIEHYRPKAGKNSYYWLGYECTNFLLSCHYCNFNKNNSFEVVGDIRLKDTDFIENNEIDFSKCNIDNAIFKNETPLFVNPITHIPKNHFEFKADGTITHKDEYGDKSIRIYNLDRDELNRARKKIVDDMRTLINSSITSVAMETKRKPQDSTFNNIINGCLIHLWKEINNPKSEFIAFRTAIFENFVDFVIKNTNGIGSSSFNILYPNELEQAYLRIKFT